MNTPSNAQIFARKIRICAMPMTSDVAGWSSPQNGSVQPPKNSVTIIPADAVMFEYSRSEEHTSELQSLRHLVCRLLLEKKKKKIFIKNYVKKLEKKKELTK